MSFIRESNKAFFRIALIETATGEIVSDIFVITDINEMSMPDTNGGVSFWNFGTVSLAIQTAVKKE